MAVLSVLGARLARECGAVESYVGSKGMTLTVKAAACCHYCGVVLEHSGHIKVMSLARPEFGKPEIVQVCRLRSCYARGVQEGYITRPDVKVK